MSATNYDSVQALGTGSYDYKIRVRVIRLWRGATRTGEEFKNFNVILLDNKSYRIHAFILTSRAEELAQVLKLGKTIRSETSLSNSTSQLTNSDEIGIVKKHDKFRDLENRNGQKQKQSKLVITDRSYSSYNIIGKTRDASHALALGLLESGHLS
ncbi:hypothetical protein AgCh_027675 [Apium graveolens]